MGLLLPPAHAHIPVAGVWRSAPEFFTPALSPLRDGLTRRDAHTLRDADVQWVDGHWVTPAPPQGRLLLKHAGGTDPVAAHLARATPDEATWTLPPETPAGRLIWREAAFPGWHVRVDGTTSSILAADGWLTTDIPAQTQQVTFTFTRQTAARRLGDLLGLLGLTAGIILLIRRTRHDEKMSSTIVRPTDFRV